jgi:hypothetical protein
MNDDLAFERVLDEALDQLAAGASLVAIVSRFPARHAAALAPLLEAATFARAGLAAAPLPPPDLARGRQRFISAAQQPPPAIAAPVEKWERVSAAMRSWWERVSPAISPLRLVLASLLAILLLAGAASASATALPGDTLYPLKRALEASRLALTFDPASRQAFDAELAARRRHEAAQVLALGREITLEFQGTVEAVSAGQLRVSGLSVFTSAAESFHPGDEVAVLARATRDGRLIAARLTLLRPAPTDPMPTLTRTVPTSTPGVTATLPAPTRPALASATAPRPTALRPTAQPSRLVSTLPPATRDAQSTPRLATPRPTDPTSASPTRPAAATSRPNSPTDSPANTPAVAAPTDRPPDPGTTPGERPAPTATPARRP